TFQNRQSDYESLEKHLLSTYSSGVYISSFDLVQIAAKLGLELPLKERDILMRKLFGEMKEQNRLNDLLAHLMLFFKDRATAYTRLGNQHIDARDVISNWIQRAKSTDMLLKREAQKVASDGQ
ncbi:MAG: hypothetical protein JXQ76_08140, partial [Campylobacterales bacterium]|nr:hypothetical protein [Campylobacterales bacterium]